MRNSKVGVIDDRIRMCSMNKDVEINKTHFYKNENGSFEFNKSVKYYSHTKDGVI